MYLEGPLKTETPPILNAMHSFWGLLCFWSQLIHSHLSLNSQPGTEPTCLVNSQGDSVLNTMGRRTGLLVHSETSTLFRVFSLQCLWNLKVSMPSNDFVAFLWTDPIIAYSYSFSHTIPPFEPRSLPVTQAGFELIILPQFLSAEIFSLIALPMLSFRTLLPLIFFSPPLSLAFSSSSASLVYEPSFSQFSCFPWWEWTLFLCRCPPLTSSASKASDCPYLPGVQVVSLSSKPKANY